MARHKFLVAGEWRDSKEILEVRSPYDGKLVGTTFRPTEGDVEDAVNAAVNAAGETGSLPTYKRSEILRNIQNGIVRRREEFAKTITLEAGKPVKDSRREVERAAHLIGLAAEEVKRTGGGPKHTAPSGTSRRERREAARQQARETKRRG